MKAFVCDSCGVTMNDPHSAKMREYYIEKHIGGNIWGDRRIKIHLCNNCYKGLRAIGENVAKECVK